MGSVNPGWRNGGEQGGWCKSSTKCGTEIQPARSPEAVKDLAYLFKYAT